MKSQTIWMPVASSPEYGDVLMLHHAGLFKHQVERSIMDRSLRDGVCMPLEDRLKQLNWRIAEFEIREVLRKSE